MSIKNVVRLTAEKLWSVIGLTSRRDCYVFNKTKYQKHPNKYEIEKCLNTEHKANQQYHIRRRLKLRKERQQAPTKVSYRPSLPTQEEYFRLCVKSERAIRPKRIRRDRNDRRSRIHRQVERDYTKLENSLHRLNRSFLSDNIKNLNQPSRLELNQHRSEVHAQLYKFNFATFKRLRRQGHTHLTLSNVMNQCTLAEYAVSIARFNLKPEKITWVYNRSVDSVITEARPPIKPAECSHRPSKIISDYDSDDEMFKSYPEREQATKILHCVGNKSSSRNRRKRAALRLKKCINT